VAAARVLQPTIGAHAPLRFDLHDTGINVPCGCTYHESRSRRRSYDTFPVNSYEAESRRSRVSSRTSTRGQKEIPRRRESEFPCTLDLRNV